MLTWVSLVLHELTSRTGRLTASEAAQLVRRSTSSFRHEFTHLAGTTFRTACLRARLERGKLLLMTTCLSIPDISNHLGYSDRTKFEKAFKRVYGNTPTQFRRIGRSGSGR